jgi:hypothetical protein
MAPRGDKVLANIWGFGEFPMPVVCNAHVHCMRWYALIARRREIEITTKAASSLDDDDLEIGVCLYISEPGLFIGDSSHLWGVHIPTA